jgi:hypothetical protein
VRARLGAMLLRPQQQVGIRVILHIRDGKGEWVVREQHCGSQKYPRS